MMIGSDRKYTSKWDLKEDSHFHPENIQGDVLRTKYGEPVSRNRSDEDYTNKTRSTTHSAVDGNYNIEMSSCLGDWRQQDQSSSPRNSWSRSPRSRSRSPVYGTGRHLKYNDKFISRSGLSSQLCKDFAAGRSKRDSFCRYRHDDNENHDSAEMKYKAHKYHTSRISGDHYSRNDRATEICKKFLRGTCLRGSSCKYVHDNAPHAYSRVSTDDMFRERERDKNRLNRYRTSEQHGGRGSGNVPCRYFAAGNCRNGRHCRFSHGQLSSSPDRRSGDHNWGPHHSMGAAEKVFEDSRWTYPSSVSGAVTSGENMKEKISDEKQKVTCWSIDEARDRSFYSENRSFADRNESNKIFGLSERNVLQLENNETGSRLAVPGPRGVGSLPVEIVMSPVWNYNIKPSTQSSKQELKTTNEDKVPVNSTVLATEKVASGEQLMKLDNLSASLAQLIANCQQLPEIYASLNSQISKDMPSFTNSNEAVMPLPPAASQSNRATELKLYNNPTSDIENLEQANIGNLRSKWTPEDPVYKSSATVPNTKQLFPDNAPISEDEENNSNLQKDVLSESYIVSNNLNPPEGHANSKESREIDRMGAHESEKIQDDEKVTDSNPLENEGTVNKVEDGKKSKNMKELRIFKFALVEVVKELLKPAWKEGKIDKEVHKTIVKKSVDKVTTTLPEVNIPQTKDKIDAYLSSSRPKLTKLVEAYVEKFHKSKTRRETS